MLMIEREEPDVRDTHPLRGEYEVAGVRWLLEPNGGSAPCDGCEWPVSAYRAEGAGLILELCGDCAEEMVGNERP